MFTRARPLTVQRTGASTSVIPSDDGYFQAGVMADHRFIDNGDGTITDRSTNLMWIADPRLADGASDRGGSGTWHLGNTYEIGSVVSDPLNQDRYYVCRAAHEAQIAILQPGTNYVYGDVVQDVAEGHFYKCTNAHTSPQVYQYLDATEYQLGEWVTDTNTGTQLFQCIVAHISSGATPADDGGSSNWSTSGNAQWLAYGYDSGNWDDMGVDAFAAFAAFCFANPTYWERSYWMTDTSNQAVMSSWQDALDHCSELTYAGYSDWRMPNANELCSIINFGSSSHLYDLFIFNNLFSYYTSTPSAVSTMTENKGIDFSGGYLFDNYQSSPCFVSPVRSL